MSKCPEGSAPCNRTPFMSEDGCDRGDLDIHMFDDLPYCGGMEPSSAEIPPEIVDTPISLPIPPPCSCISVGYNIKAGFSKGGASTATFASKGDCCNGEYESNINLSLPCPLPKIENFAGIRYGTGTGRKKYIQSDPSKCTLQAYDIDLNIPCPV